ncbi:hypothetical protein N9M66_01425 [Litoreibacter sp.]|nr:hypothetical protein [Litoreibacter sp.]
MDVTFGYVGQRKTPKAKRLTQSFGRELSQNMWQKRLMASPAIRLVTRLKPELPTVPITRAGD